MITFSPAPDASSVRLKDVKSPFSLDPELAEVGVILVVFYPVKAGP